MVDMADAWRAPALVRRFNWRVRGRRPTRLLRFGRDLVRTIAEQKPVTLLTIGTAPIDAQTLDKIGKLGVCRINYLTDDPWNPRHRARWFLNALPAYDHVFSPRRSNLDDLIHLGCPRVTYLPFAYDEELFYSDPESPKAVASYSAPDVVFAGGADQDRVPYIGALIQAGISIALYGDYWRRFAETRGYSLGHADPQTLRKAICRAKVALCLVRRSNRDGHSMRTFEVPAIGACMLVEDTEEHREIFGEEKNAVLYFSRVDEMIEKTRWLLQHDKERGRLARAAHELIVRNRNTYCDRLQAILRESTDARKI